MLSKLFVGVALATMFTATTLPGQSIGQLGGPANYPPPGFKGQQYADNRGCIFLRAGFGNTVNWVPRVDRARKPLCGFPPTFGRQVAAAVEADMAPQPPIPGGPTGTLGVAAVVPAPTPVPQPTVMTPAAPVRTAAAPTPAPGPTVFVNPAPAAQPAAPRPAPPARTAMAAPSPAPGPTVFAGSRPVAPAAPPAPGGGLFGFLFAAGNPAPTPATQPAPSQPAPMPVAIVAAQPGYQTTAPGTASVRCFTSAPRLERVLLRNGGNALVCTRGDGTLSGWRPPVFANGSGVGAALANPPLNAHTMAGAVVIGGATATAPVARPPIVVARTAIPTPPKGYKLAWKDDRLNPQRAQGTAQGQAAQDQVWTRTTPADLVAVAAPATPALNTSVSTMSAPQIRVTAAASGAAYVQVGTFGQPANATGAAARLAALGLPVATSRITRSGKALQIVLAGPFDSTAAAQSALVTLRGAGFGDAILK